MTVEQIRPRCFLDIEIENEYVGRIIVELFSDICPITCENFRALCTGEKGIGKLSNHPLHYKGTVFHRVVKNFVIQGGDFTLGSSAIGGESIYGGTFKDENFEIKHDRPFLLSMANRGKDTNGSQFFITTKATPHLDGTHTAFGNVVSGTKVVDLIQNTKTDQSCRPIKDVRISNCGELILTAKAKDKKRRKSATDSSASEDDSDAKGKSKKKKKHKKNKKHKKEKKDINSNLTMYKDHDDVETSINPDEIPSVPANNFLMRRTSPLGDNNRRNMTRSREPYQRRPSRSRSGRKIKGRGFMRYRTPSPTASRSGSETPPHWKQAQSRLRSLKDVIPKKDSTPSEDSQSQPDEDDGVLRNSVLQSRLGHTAKTSTETNLKDARMNIRENRRNKELNSSPPRRSEKDMDSRSRLFKQLLHSPEDRHTSRNFKDSSPKQRDYTSPLRSKIVVKSSTSVDVEDKLSERISYRRYSDRRGRRDYTPERKPYGSHSEYPSKRENSSYHKKSSDSHSANETKKIVEKPQKQSGKVEKRFKSLEKDLFRYRKSKAPSIDGNESEEGVKNKKNYKSRTEANVAKENPIVHEEIYEQENISIAVERKVEREKVQNTAENLAENDNEIMYHETPKEESELLETSKQLAMDDNSFTEDVALNSATVDSNIVAEKNPSPTEKFDTDEYSHHESPPSPNEMQEENGYENTQKMEALKEENETNVVANYESCTQSSDSATSDTKEKLSKSEIANSSNINSNYDINSEEVKMSSEEEHSSVHNKYESRKVPAVFSPESFDCVLPDVIPLPEESVKSVNSSETVQQENIVKSPEVEEIQQTVESNTSERKEDVEIEEEKPTALKESDNERDSYPNPEITYTQLHSPDHLKDTHDNVEPSTSSAAPTISTMLTKIQPLSPKAKSSISKTERSLSPDSPKSSNTHVRKRKSKSPSKESPVSRRRRRSTERRSKSPADRTRSPPRRTRVPAGWRSKSRSRSRSPRRSISPQRNRNRNRRYSRSPEVRPRRSRSRPRNDGRGSHFYRYSGIRNRSPDRRGNYQRRYNKSPSYRGRARGRSGTRRSRTRSSSRSINRRRRRERRSTSSSDSTSSRNSSSSGSEGAKKRSNRRRNVKGRNKRSSSSSSSGSKRSHSDSGST